MSDIVERLRSRGVYDGPSVTDEAAAEITRLRKHAAGLALERDGFQEECKRLRADLAAAQEREQRMREALERIEQWGRAYPLSVFPEPDFDKARKALEAAGLTLDAVSASNMRHVVEGVSEIARAGLGEPQAQGCPKWGPDFPPSCCTAWEDCVSDGMCHDPNCGAPSQHSSEDSPND